MSQAFILIEELCDEAKWYDKNRLGALEHVPYITKYSINLGRASEDRRVASVSELSFDRVQLHIGGRIDYRIARIIQKRKIPKKKPRGSSKNRNKTGKMD
jgi:hypothetical protein